MTVIVLVASAIVIIMIIIIIIMIIIIMITMHTCEWAVIAWHQLGWKKKETNTTFN